MQETTFNKAFQADGPWPFSDTSAWLNALYTEASVKKFDQNELYHIISNDISFDQLELKINYKFKDKINLIKTLMQSSFCYEMKETTLLSNERLEFLGDSLINLIVGKNLFHKYMNNNEGDLSKLRGALVNEEKLAELARTIELGNFVFLGKGELRTGGADKDSILADTFEALLAGIYFDSNSSLETLEAVFKTIVELLEAKNKIEFYSLNQLEDFDTKSKLQELTMATHGAFPSYKAVEMPNNGGYKVEVWLGTRMLAEMSGSSKKKIEKLLAKKIIEQKLY